MTLRSARAMLAAISFRWLAGAIASFISCPFGTIFPRGGEHLPVAVFASLLIHATAQQHEPIIEMHMHALAPNAQGPPPLAMCIPFANTRRCRLARDRQRLPHDSLYAFRGARRSVPFHGMSRYSITYFSTLDGRGAVPAGSDRRTRPTTSSPATAAASLCQKLSEIN